MDLGHATGGLAIRPELAAVDGFADRQGIGIIHVRVRNVVFAQLRFQYDIQQLYEQVGNPIRFIAFWSGIDQNDGKIPPEPITEIPFLAGIGQLAICLSLERSIRCFALNGNDQFVTSASSFRISKRPSIPASTPPLGCHRKPISSSRRSIRLTPRTPIMSEFLIFFGGYGACGGSLVLDLSFSLAPPTALTLAVAENASRSLDCPA